MKKAGLGAILPLDLNFACQETNRESYLPVRAVAEYLGYTVSYHEQGTTGPGHQKAGWKKGASEAGIPVSG